MKETNKNKIGLTLVELILAVFLMSIVFLAVSSLYVASQRFYFTANNEVIISYELQYAVDHIYKNTMQAMGDETSAPGSRPINVPNSGRLNININTNDPLTQSNYEDTVAYRYRYQSGRNELQFSEDGSGWETLLRPDVTVTDVNFSLDGNLLTVSLTASYKDEELTFYSACYPRLASFQ